MNHPLPWTHNRFTASALLERLRSSAPHLLRDGRGPEFDPRWNLMLKGNPDDTKATDEDRRAYRDSWERVRIGSALVRGADLTGCTGEPGYVDLATSVAKWVAGALGHVVGLERDLSAMTAARDEQVVLRDGAREVLATTRAALAAETATLSRERLHRTEERAAHEARLSADRAELADLRAQLAASRSSEAAWKVAAEASGNALHVLRVATGIPLASDGAMVVRRAG